MKKNAIKEFEARLDPRIDELKRLYFQLYYNDRSGFDYMLGLLRKYYDDRSESLDIRPMSEYNGAPVYKIVFMCTERSQLDEPMEVLKDYFVFCVQNLEAVGCLNGEVFGLDFNKG